MSLVGDGRKISHLPFLMANAILSTMQTTIDKAGRVVVPKPIRDRLRFRPDTPITLELTGDGLLLRAASRETSLVWRDGIPVLTGEPLAGVDWERLVDDEREERMRKQAGQ